MAWTDRQTDLYTDSVSDDGFFLNFTTPELGLTLKSCSDLLSPTSEYVILLKKGVSESTALTVNRMDPEVLSVPMRREKHCGNQSDVC